MTHYLAPGNADRVLKPVDIPELEEGNIHAYMRGIQSLIRSHPLEEAGKVLDVVHD